MNKFDRICAVVTIPTGIVFMILGGIGLFLGSSAHFTLPPIWGFWPFLLGWAMCVTLIKFWKSSSESSDLLEVASFKFQEFLIEHPKFKEAPMKLQWSAFHQWLDSK